MELINNAGFFVCKFAGGLLVGFVMTTAYAWPASRYW
jgi:hypothetical protein